MGDQQEKKCTEDGIHKEVVPAVYLYHDSDVWCRRLNRIITEHEKCKDMLYKWGLENFSNCNYGDQWRTQGGGRLRDQNPPENQFCVRY